MAYSLYENLKGFFTGKPPLVVFIICLGMFAIVLLTLAYYVKFHEIQNPDISEDWNMFLENFAELEFCITSNSTDSITSASPVTTIPPKTSPKTTHHPTQTIEAVSPHVTDDDGLRNYSVSLLLKIQPTKEFLSIPHNLTHVSATVLGKELGLVGDAAEEQLNVTAEIPYDWMGTKCDAPYGCQEVQVYTCVHFLGSHLMFPTSRSPPVCENYNETGVDYHAKMKAHKPKSMFPIYYCRSRPVIKIHYKFNPTLAVWLSLRDRSVINLHLMHTSYFLFVMVIMLFCYALIKQRPSKNKHTSTDTYEKLSVGSRA